VATADLSHVPEQHHDEVRSALIGAFGPSGASALHTVRGGASGALTFRVESVAGDHLLRVETISGPVRNPHQYACMQIAADAGVAPAVRYLDADAGIVVMPFITHRPLSDYAGGPGELIRAMADLLHHLHETPGFPEHGDYLDNLARMLAYLDRSGRVAPGLLDDHVAAFERVRSAYPWAPDRWVSAHNDPNQFNVLYDGDRLWLIDWETAYRNDPIVDVATVASHVAPTSGLREVLLARWLGRQPDAATRARAILMGWLVQLYAGCILLTVVVDPANETHADLSAMTPEAFGAGIESGELRAGTPRTTHAYAKLALAAFVDAARTPEFDAALVAVASG
jgi:aminoglycoside phosphotransferase (APT) family kinase protein